MFKIMYHIKKYMSAAFLDMFSGKRKLKIHKKIPECSVTPSLQFIFVHMVASYIQLSTS